MATGTVFPHKLVGELRKEIRELETRNAACDHRIALLAESLTESDERAELLEQELTAAKERIVTLESHQIILSDWLTSERQRHKYYREAFEELRSKLEARI